mmetsp:Transcript_29370/g.54406  ORF Transcript_29370/g.54406 Transcript_29370/m.54406 type:complete len:84 (+) Transcript_29370:32-283(+)
MHHLIILCYEISSISSGHQYHISMQDIQIQHASIERQIEVITASYSDLVVVCFLSLNKVKYFGVVLCRVDITPQGITVLILIS